jgi:hypothetical protein
VVLLAESVSEMTQTAVLTIKHHRLTLAAGDAARALVQTCIAAGSPRLASGVKKAALVLMAIFMWDKCFANPQARVSILKIQLAQSVQDETDSVPLIGGKPTIARVYISGSGAVMNIIGHLIVQDSSGKTLATLVPGGSLYVDPKITRDAMTSYESTLNFDFVDRITKPGPITLRMQDIIDANTGQRITCDNCDTFRTTKTFKPTVTLHLRIVLFAYNYQGESVLPLPNDVLYLKSWLARAYPVSDLQVSQQIFQIPEVGFDFTCNSANSFLAQLRQKDLDMDARTHLLGLVSNRAQLMRGCAPVPVDAPDPSFFIASAPAGHPGDKNQPENAGGDKTSKTFTEWYGGHELAHTFGRLHPGKCFDEADEDKKVHYDDKGHIATQTRAFAYDAGDDSSEIKNANIVIPARFLSGMAATDLMTYCLQPNWPSAYTYKGLYDRLVAEASLPPSTSKPQSPATATPASSGPGDLNSITQAHAGPPMAVITDNTVAQANTPENSPVSAGEAFENIIATINLSQMTGNIVAAMQADRPIQGGDGASPEPQTGASPLPTAAIRFVNSTGDLIAQFNTKIRPDTDTLPGKDQLALIQTTVQRPQNATTLQLVLGDKIIDQRHINEAPPMVADVPANANGARGTKNETILQWSASHPAGAPLTYTVQGSKDGKKWIALAAGLKDPHLKLLPQQQMPWYRVIANDGFNDSVPTIIRSPIHR